MLEIAPVYPLKIRHYGDTIHLLVVFEPPFAKRRQIMLNSKKSLINIKKYFSLFTIIAIFIFAFTTCSTPHNPQGAQVLGSISGRALFSNSDNNAGITVTLEQTDGLRSVAAITAARSIEQGSQSIDVSRAVAGQTSTADDGSYSFANLGSGTYTIYASSKDSMEKAVAINVVLEAGKAITVDDLNLTAVGSIAGWILVDGGTTGNVGFLVSVAGTSYMATTADDGSFTISDVPAGDSYMIVITKGNYTSVMETIITVERGKTTSLEPKQIDGTDLDGSGGIIWKGELAAAPDNPQLNWAYFNTLDRTAYIWNGTKWELLAAPGAGGSITGEGVEWITIIEPVAITGYPQGGSFSAAGLVIRAHYIDGSTVDVTSGYTLSWNGQIISDGNTEITEDAGAKTVTVTWQGKSAAFSISVSNSNNFIVTNTSQWNAALGSIKASADNQDYIIYINGNVGVTGSTNNSFGSAANVSVTITSGYGSRLYLTSPGNMIHLSENQTLYIDSAELTLEGLTNGKNGASQDNNQPVVYVSGANSKLELRNGTIRGNTPGGGVLVEEEATFIMKGGYILANTGFGVHVDSDGSFIMDSGNIIDNMGSGVAVNNYGSFTMKGGNISGNTAESGGGVWVGTRGNFTMNSGEISENSGRYGGGVRVSGSGSCSFTMNGGSIIGNVAEERGGGVQIGSAGHFYMNDGKIQDNTAEYGGGVYSSSDDFSASSRMENGKIIGNTASFGGGVYVGRMSGFTMAYGEISGNTAEWGGAVYVGHWGVDRSGMYIGSFRMIGGIIYGNTAQFYGGGIVIDGGVLNKTGGTITGYASDSVKGNVVKDSFNVVLYDYGHAVYAFNEEYEDDDEENVIGETIKRREETAGPGVDLYFSYDSDGNLLWSGDWDY